MEPTGTRRLLQLTPPDRAVHRAGLAGRWPPAASPAPAHHRSRFGLRVTAPLYGSTGFFGGYVRRVSRGVVLWLDEAASLAVRTVWDELAERGLPSQASHTHRLHQSP